MRVLLLGLALALPVVGAPEARPSTTQLTCEAASALVSSQRAVVLDTGPGTYDRFVSDRSQCLGQEMTRPAWARTADNPQCVLGYVCVPRDGRKRF